jgi:hypothetical protein
VFPAWDCLPYTACRPTGYGRAAGDVEPAGDPQDARRARIISASVGAALQRVPPRACTPRPPPSCARADGRRGLADEVSSENGAAAPRRSWSRANRGARRLLTLPARPSRCVWTFSATRWKRPPFDPMSQRSTGTATRSCCSRSAKCCSRPEHRALPQRLSRAVRQRLGRGPALRGGVGFASCRCRALAAAVPRSHGDAVDYCPASSRRTMRRRHLARYELIADYYDAPEDRRQGRHDGRRISPSAEPLHQALRMGAMLPRMHSSRR